MREPPVEVWQANLLKRNLVWRSISAAQLPPHKHSEARKENGSETDQSSNEIKDFFGGETQREG
jgi:hypothetical protein